MKVDGRCLCGYISYEATVDPERVAICHCTDCQTHSGSAFGVVAGVVDQDFRLLSGELKLYEKTAESGRVRALGFCPDCGTRIYARTLGNAAAFFGLRVGTIRQRDQLPPRRQVWCRSAQGWAMNLAAIPAYADQDITGPPVTVGQGEAVSQRPSGTR
jgi:hypothetical protein